MGGRVVLGPSISMDLSWLHATDFFIKWFFLVSGIFNQ
jgi:hypothetical protein